MAELDKFNPFNISEMQTQLLQDNNVSQSLYTQVEIAGILYRISDNPVLDAMEYHNHDAASILISEGLADRWSIEEFEKAFIYCLRDENLRNLEFVVKRGALVGLDINAGLINESKDNSGIKYLKGDKAIDVFSKLGKLEIVSLLVENGARLDIYNSLQKTPLYSALEYERDDVARYLISVQESLWNDANYLMQIVNLAKQKEKFELASAIITKAQVSPKAGEGSGLLHSVKMNNEIFDLVVSKFPEELTRENFNGNTPLHSAIRRGDLEFARKLLNFDSVKLSVNQENFHSSRTALNFALEYEDDITALKMAKLLIENGAKVMRETIMSLKMIDKSTCESDHELYDWLTLITQKDDFHNIVENIKPVTCFVGQSIPAFGSGIFKPVVIRPADDLSAIAERENIMEAIGDTSDIDME